MTDAFDPYYRWLGIPPKDQPGNHYRLLAIDLFESDAEVIRDAAEQRMAHVRTYQLGPHSALSQRILNELASAKACLLNSEKKAAYDKRLREQVRSAGPESDDSSGDMALDPGLATALKAGQAAAPSRHAARTRVNLAAIVGVAAVAGVVLLALVIWGMVKMGSSRDSARADPRPNAVLEAERDQRGEEPPAPTPPAPPKPTEAATPVAPAEPVEKPTALGKTETPPPAEPTGHPIVSEAAPAEKEPAPKPEPNVPEEPKRQPVPSAAAQQEIASRVEDVYKLAAARKPAEQVKLAKDLAESAEKATKPEERFVMLRKAAELACEADDTALMFQVVDRLGEQFELDALATKQKLLAKVAVGANDAARIKSLVESSSVLIDEALGGERFDVALELASAASRVCQKPSGAPLRKQVIERRKEIQGLQKQSEQTAALGGDIPTVSGKQPLLAVAPFDEKAAKRHQANWAKYLRVPVVQTNSIGMRLALIPPGEFMMGSPKEFIEEELRLYAGDGWYKERLPGEGPQHRVRITRPYWLGVTEVTQEEYQRVMGSNPSKFQGDPRRPVEQVTWDEAVEFCRRMSELPAEKAAQRRYGLPTEAQWEHACRAGNPGPCCFSPHSGPLSAGVEEKLLGEYAWFKANAGGHTHAVGQKRANVWGLYDIYGSVWEWCQDWHDRDYYVKSRADDPTGPLGGSGRVNRGGSWLLPAWGCRSAGRLDFGPGSRFQFLGFRVSQVLADK